jgi:recombination protein RecT
MTHAIDTTNKPRLGVQCTCGAKFAVPKAIQAHIERENAVETPDQYKTTEAEVKAGGSATEPDKVDKSEPVASATEGVAPETKEVPVAEPTAKNIVVPEGTGVKIEASPIEEVTEVAVPKPQPGQGVKAYLNNKSVQGYLADLLKERKSRFVTSLTAAMNASPKLAECSPETVLKAAIMAASLDLPINSTLGFAYLIPYKDRKRGMEAQMQIGYKGFIQLAQRSGQYKTIAAVPVYEGQLIDEDPLLGNTYDWKAKKSSQIIGYVSIFKLLNGFEKQLYMPADLVESHAKRYSQSYRSHLEKGYSSMWSDDFDAMAIKTVLKLLISKFGPMSIDMQKAMFADQSVIEGETVDYPDNQPEYVDKIQSATSRDELSAIMQTLTVDERKDTTLLIQAKLGEVK